MTPNEKIQAFLNSRGASLPITGNLLDMTKAAAERYLRDQFKKLGYEWPAICIVGVRRQTKYSNAFEDIGVVIINGKVVDLMPWTTVPGRFYVYNPLTVGGVTGAAVIAAGYYKKKHAFRKNYTNKWKSPYFEQIGDLEIYRDGNKNDIIDKGLKYPSPPWHGIFLHRMGMVFNYIWNWSAGCQGTLDNDWEAKVVPHFYDGQIIDYCVIEDFA